MFNPHQAQRICRLSGLNQTVTLPYQGILILIGLIIFGGCSEQAGNTTSATRKSNFWGQQQVDELWQSQREGSVDLTCSDSPQGWDPNGVHELGNGPQFEGWYYRVTEPESGESWVLIIAYWRGNDGEGRSFIELIQGSTGTVYKQIYEPVDIAQYQKTPGTFALKIGDVYASADMVSGYFTDDSGTEVNLSLNFDACAYWGAPKDQKNRWTMGWVTELIGPPLKWHVHHLKGEANGALIISSPDGHDFRADFSGAPVHQEKNWGRAFPKRWVWLQSNVFEGRPDVAFVAAGGPIFGFNLSPEGYMVGLRWRDHFFNWRTQDGHVFKNVDFTVDHERELAVWTMQAESFRYRADIRATGRVSELIPIDVPTAEGLVFGAYEHLSAELTIDIYVREGLAWRLLDQVISSHTAVEAGGELARRLTLQVQ